MRRRSPSANQRNSSTSRPTSPGTPGVDGLEERVWLPNTVRVVSIEVTYVLR